MTTLYLLPLYKELISFLDLILVYLLIYRILIWLKRTHAFDLIKGLFPIFIVFLISIFLELSTMKWILERFTGYLIIIVFIIFQPELRRFLERVGSTGNLFSLSTTGDEKQSASVIQQILRSVEFLSKEKIGALIVIEGASTLQEYINTGIPIKGELNSEILPALFWPGSPTHDGAVIIREDTIEAAGCFLPLTQTSIADRRLGTRHRAGLGLAEISDAVIIIISEENGVISLVENGDMTRFLNREALETRLFSLYAKAEKTESESFIKWPKFLTFK